MNRYNQGFFKFGPMEQCKDGIWGKYADFLKVLKLAVSLKNSRITELEKQLDEANTKIRKLEQRLQFADKSHSSFINKVASLVLLPPPSNKE